MFQRFDIQPEWMMPDMILTGNIVPDPNWVSKMLDDKAAWEATLEPAMEPSDNLDNESGLDGESTADDT